MADLIGTDMSPRKMAEEDAHDKTEKSLKKLVSTVVGVLVITAFLTVFVTFDKVAEKFDQLFEAHTTAILIAVWTILIGAALYYGRRNPKQ